VCKKDYIKNLPLFSSLSGAVLDKLLLISEIKHLSAGVFAYEGDKTTKIVFLVSGAIEAYKLNNIDSSIFLYSLNDGALVSDICEGGILTYKANYECLSDCVLLSVDYSRFLELVLPHAAVGFLNMVTFKSDLLDKAVNINLVYDAIGKVSYFLRTDLKLFNEISNIKISKMLNISQETLSRVLKKLELSKIIQSSSKPILILDTHKLCDNFV